MLHIPLTSDQEQAMWEIAQHSGSTTVASQILLLLEKELGSVDPTTIKVRKLILEINNIYNKNSENRDKSGLQDTLFKRLAIKNCQCNLTLYPDQLELCGECLKK